MFNAPNVKKSDHEVAIPSPLLESILNSLKGSDCTISANKQGIAFSTKKDSLGLLKGRNEDVSFSNDNLEPVELVFGLDLLKDLPLRRMDATVHISLCMDRGIKLSYFVADSIRVTCYLAPKVNVDADQTLKQGADEVSAKVCSATDASAVSKKAILSKKGQDQKVSKLEKRPRKRHKLDVAKPKKCADCLKNENKH